MTPQELRRNAAQADAQGAHALAERLRERAAHLEERPVPDVATMATSDLEELSRMVGAELARRREEATG